jgi:cold shock CspA family protein
MFRRIKLFPLAVMDEEREPLYRTEPELGQARRVAEAKSKFLFQYVAPVIIGSPVAAGYARINTGSGIVVRLADGDVFVTADHVVSKYCKALEKDETVSFQVGHLNLRLDTRHIWRHEHDDLALLPLRDHEAERIGTMLHTPPEWPPSMPVRNDFVTVCGLPIMARSRPDPGSVTFGPLIAHLPVLNSFANHFTCRIDRAYIESILGRPLPRENVDYGGMSGGPVFLERAFDFPLVGFVKEVHPELEYFVIQGFGVAPLTADTIRTARPFGCPSS